MATQGGRGRGRGRGGSGSGNASQQPQQQTQQQLPQLQQIQQLYQKVIADKQQLDSEKKTFDEKKAAFETQKKELNGNEKFKEAIAELITQTKDSKTKLDRITTPSNDANIEEFINNMKKTVDNIFNFNEIIIKIDNYIDKINFGLNRKDIIDSTTKVYDEYEKALNKYNQAIDEYKESYSSSNKVTDNTVKNSIESTEKTVKKMSEVMEKAKIQIRIISDKYRNRDETIASYEDIQRAKRDAENQIPSEPSDNYDFRKDIEKRSKLYIKALEIISDFEKQDYVEHFCADDIANYLVETNKSDRDIAKFFHHFDQYMNDHGGRFSAIMDTSSKDTKSTILEKINSLDVNTSEQDLKNNIKDSLKDKKINNKPINVDLNKIVNPVIQNLKSKIESFKSNLTDNKSNLSKYTIAVEDTTFKDDDYGKNHKKIKYAEFYAKAIIENNLSITDGENFENALLIAKGEWISYFKKFDKEGDRGKVNETLFKMRNLNYYNKYCFDGDQGCIFSDNVNNTNLLRKIDELGNRKNEELGKILDDTNNLENLEDSIILNDINEPNKTLYKNKISNLKNLLEEKEKRISEEIGFLNKNKNEFSKFIRKVQIEAEYFKIIKKIANVYLENNQLNVIDYFLILFQEYEKIETFTEYSKYMYASIVSLKMNSKIKEKERKYTSNAKFDFSNINSVYHPIMRNIQKSDPELYTELTSSRDVTDRIKIYIRSKDVNIDSFFRGHLMKMQGDGLISGNNCIEDVRNTSMLYGEYNYDINYNGYLSDNTILINVNNLKSDDMIKYKEFPSPDCVPKDVNFYNHVYDRILSQMDNIKRILSDEDILVLNKSMSFVESISLGEKDYNDELERKRKRQALAIDKGKKKNMQDRIVLTNKNRHEVIPVLYIYCKYYLNKLDGNNVYTRDIESNSSKNVVMLLNSDKIINVPKKDRKNKPLREQFHQIFHSEISHAIDMTSPGLETVENNCDLAAEGFIKKFNLSRNNPPPPPPSEPEPEVMDLSDSDLAME